MLRIQLLILTLLLMACDPGARNGGQVTPEISSSLSKVMVVEVIPGAEQLPLYVPHLKGKRCGMVVNQSSLVGEEHLVDTLRRLDVDITGIYVPEHGFRGNADAGAHIVDGIDPATGIEIISLYGKNRKPTAEHLTGIEVMVFDLQDVGVRCYTYISTLHYVMEACAENNIPLIVLDRPNPNGHYVDGPILEEAFSSFIGMHPVPFVYGMTIGEYARMIKGENWIDLSEALDLKVVPCHHYNHHERYVPPISPSPNLRTERSILLYPSLVWFEGTVVSVGRGTDTPFEVYGHPDLVTHSFTFTPRSMPGASSPKLEGQQCLGKSYSAMDPHQIRQWKRVHLDILVETYKYMDDGQDFFLDNGFFDKLAGTDQLRMAIEKGRSAEEIRSDWQAGLLAFEKIRRKYLIYSDES